MIQQFLEMQMLTVYMAEDSGATVFAGGLNNSGGTTISTFKFGTLTMGDSETKAFTVSGVTLTQL